MLPKVAQVYRFLKEKGEQSRNILERFVFFNLPKSAVATRKKYQKLDQSVFKTQQLCTIVAINRSMCIALKMGQKIMILPDFTALVGLG